MNRRCVNSMTDRMNALSTFVAGLIVFGVLTAIYVWGPHEIFDIALAWVASHAAAKAGVKWRKHNELAHSEDRKISPRA